ncbi:phage tail tape measure protein [Niallia circulans]|uniref:phage tail tape measure protein n=1 Tax=Niallia circulans TaxID=1397 RepID=UPI003D96A000
MIEIDWIYKETNIRESEVSVACSLRESSGGNKNYFTTLLTNSILRLIKPTEKGVNQINKYNFLLFNSNKKLKSLDNLLKEFKLKISELSVEEKVFTLEKIFGMDNIKLWCVLLEKGDRYEKQNTRSS